MSRVALSAVWSAFSVLFSVRAISSATNCSLFRIPFVLVSQEGGVSALAQRQYHEPAVLTAGLLRCTVFVPAAC